MRMASTSGNSSGTTEGVVVALAAVSDFLLRDVNVERGRDSSHPALSSSFVPAYSTRVQDGTGEDSHSDGLSSSLPELGCRTLAD